MFSGGFCLEVRGSPVILIINSRTDVRRGVNSDEELLIDLTLRIKRNTRLTALNRDTTYTITAPRVRLRGDGLEVRQARRSEQRLNAERAVDVTFVSFEVDVQISIGASPVRAGISCSIRSSSHLIPLN